MVPSEHHEIHSVWSQGEEAGGLPEGMEDDHKQGRVCVCVFTIWGGMPKCVPDNVIVNGWQLEQDVCFLWTSCSPWCRCCDWFWGCCRLTCDWSSPQGIPQQKNDSDCGVFVLEVSLASSGHSTSAVLNLPHCIGICGQCAEEKGKHIQGWIFASLSGSTAGVWPWNTLCSSPRMTCPGSVRESTRSSVTVAWVPEPAALRASIVQPDPPLLPGCSSTALSDGPLLLCRARVIHNKHSEKEAVLLTSRVCLPIRDGIDAPLFLRGG